MKHESLTSKNKRLEREAKISKEYAKKMAADRKRTLARAELMLETAQEITKASSSMINLLLTKFGDEEVTITADDIEAAKGMKATYTVAENGDITFRMVKDDEQH